VWALLERHGTTFARELGARDGDLFALLVGAALLAAPIRASAAVAGARAIFDAGLGTPEALARAGARRRTALLRAAGYGRWTDRTGVRLGHLAEQVRDGYEGDLRALREEADRDPDNERALLLELPGIGEVAADIFFREAQTAWRECMPFADARAVAGARSLRLGSTPEALAALVPPTTFARFACALVRCQMAGDAPQVLAAARAVRVRARASGAVGCKRARPPRPPRGRAARWPAGRCGFAALRRACDHPSHMRVLMLCVDLGDAYPRGARALRLATALAAAGHDVEVLARDDADASPATVVPVHDAPPMIEAWERARWAMQFSSQMLERAVAAIAARGADVVHAHDWEVSWAARSAARLAEAPLVATLHSTERSRGRGRLRYDDSELIDGAERALCRDAVAVVAPTRALASSLAPLASRVETIELARISDARLVARTVAVYENAARRARTRAHDHAALAAAAAREQLG
jgi:hypothetical protein